MTEVYSWEDLMKNPSVINGGVVELRGQITGSLIEELGEEPGIRTVISPHSVRSGLHPVVDNLEMKVHVFLPGELSDVEIQTLRLMKEYSSCLYVKGTFQYELEDDEDYLGSVKATSWQQER